MTCSIILCAVHVFLAFGTWGLKFRHSIDWLLASGTFIYVHISSPMHEENIVEGYTSLQKILMIIAVSFHPNQLIIIDEESTGHILSCIQGEENLFDTIVSSLIFLTVLNRSVQIKPSTLIWFSDDCWRWTSTMPFAFSTFLPPLNVSSCCHVSPVSYTHLDVYKRQTN